MNFLKKMFVNGNHKNKPTYDHAVIIRFDYGIQRMDELYALADELENIIEKNQLGEYDGHEMAMDYSDGMLFMYGPNAENLFNGIKATLEQTDFMKGAEATLRFGPPEAGVKEITVTIGK